MVSNDFGNTGGGALTDTDAVAIKVTATPGNPADAPQTPPPGSDGDPFRFQAHRCDNHISGNEVIVDTGDEPQVLTGFEVFKFTDGTVNNNDSDPLVDDLFYYSHNHDVWNAHADADAHYHSIGWHEGRDPDAFFSTSTYLSLNPSVKALGVDPLLQFDQGGWKVSDPSIAFDNQKYLAANPDVKAAGVDPLAHFLQYGAQEGRQPIAPSVLLAAERLRLCLLSAAQSGRGGGACRSVPAFRNGRLEGRAQPERLLRRQGLSCGLRRCCGGGRQSARSLRPDRLERRARPVGQFRHQERSGGLSRRRRRAYRSADAVPAVRHQRRSRA